MRYTIPVLIILIFVVPTYFLSKNGLKKMNLGNHQSRKYIALIPTLIFSVFMYLGIIYLWLFMISYYPSNKFNKKLWETNIAERYKMSEDIIQSRMLIGKTKDEVIGLLGKEFYSYGENHMAYVLGFVPGLSNIDPDILDIYFENGTVIQVEQHQT